jgi:hypothetical protein
VKESKEKWKEERGGEKGNAEGERKIRKNGKKRGGGGMRRGRGEDENKVACMGGGGCKAISLAQRLHQLPSSLPITSAGIEASTAHCPRPANS